MVLNRPGLAALALCAAAVAAGCVRDAPVRRLEQPTSIAVAFVQDAGSEIGAAPPAFVDALAEVLRQRNLVPELVPTERFADAFATRRESRHRLEHLATLSDAPYLLLVETRAEYYSQISGRFRWTVHAKLSLARRDQLAASSVDQSDVPVVLQLEREREDAAIAGSARALGKKLGRLVDDFLAGVGARTSPAPASARSARPDSIYFVLVDRFANGDRGNDGAVDRDDPHAFHGGDLAGLRQRLDHIDRLGVKSVWISPVFAMRTAKLGEHGAFHGYWTEDLRRIEPRFGSEDELAALADDLRARGMELILDVVLNHVGYETRLVRERPGWFHGAGAIEDWDDPVELTTRDVHGLPDLAQEKAEVYRYLVEASVDWLERIRPAAFRLDAVKHVSMDFWSRYNEELRERSGGALALLGELYDGSPSALVRGFEDGGFDALFDFPLHFAMLDVFCRGQHAGRLASVLALDRLYDDPRRLVTFADNHDLPRVATSCGGDLDRVGELLRFQLTARGVPAFTYGVEAGLTGAAEPDNRGDMVFGDDLPLAALLRDGLALRAAHPVLVDGRSLLVHVSPSLLVYARVLPDAAALIAVNTGDAPAEVPVPSELAGARARDAFSGAPLPTPLRAPAGRTQVVLFSAAPAAGFAALHRRAGDHAPVPITVRVAGAPAGALRLVGSAPELGAWDPGAAPALRREPDGAASVALSLPRRSAAAFKLVVEGDGGARTWEPGDDRHLFVESEGTSIGLTWGR